MMSDDDVWCLMSDDGVRCMTMYDNNNFDDVDDDVRCMKYDDDEDDYVRWRRLWCMMDDDDVWLYNDGDNVQCWLIV